MDEGVRQRAGGRTGCERGEGRTDGNEKYSKFGRSQTKTREGEQESEKHSKGRTEGGMYVEVDGWIVHGKYRESRAE